MHIQDVLYYGFWAGLFFLMMRFGCGRHIMGHGHRHRDVAPAVPGTSTGNPSRHRAPGREHR
jgi:hypothetical protein